MEFIKLRKNSGVSHKREINPEDLKMDPFNAA